MLIFNYNLKIIKGKKFVYFLTEGGGVNVDFTEINSYYDNYSQIMIF